ncbi:MAG: sigma-70 family RNA polymerase sigma factor [Clostridiales bacterium]|nr:sigma-70 family RNA polymerase sigma factor [Clostridiales bacterium]
MKNNDNSKTNSFNNDSFIEENLGLVHSLANRFRGRGIEYEELYSAGCMGLVKAANNFEPERGLKFSTYAVPVILGELKRLFRDGGTVKVSRSLKERSMKVVAMRDELIKKGEEPKLSAIAQSLGLDVYEVSEALGVSLPAISLTFDDEKSFDIPVQSEESLITDKIALRELLKSLDKDDRKLIVLRYWKNKTQNEVAVTMGMTQVQVSRKEKKLLQELRKQLLS